MQANADAADLLGSGEALAYAVGTCVAIVDLPRMKIAAVLAGCHRYARPLLLDAIRGVRRAAVHLPYAFQAGPTMSLRRHQLFLYL